MKCYNVAGTVIGFNTPASPIESVIESNFRLCSKTQRPPTLKISGSTVDLNRFVDALPDWLAALASAAKPSFEPAMAVTAEGTAVIAKDHDSISCAWLSKNNKVLHFCGGRQGELPTPMVIQPLIAPLLRDIKIQAHQILLHAAAVCMNNGTGILVSAPGYGGKTTTTMSLVSHGAKLLGDDLVAVPPVDAQITAIGIPEPLNLTTQTMAYFEECRHLAAGLAPEASKTKTAVSPMDIFGPDCLMDQCPLHIAYFVRIDDKGPAVRRLGTREALEQFAAAHIFVRRQTISPHCADRLLDIVAHMQVYELFTGPDPIALGHWIASNLDRHLHG